jgi:hypothetical protein
MLNVTIGFPPRAATPNKGSWLKKGRQEIGSRVTVARARGKDG